MSTTGALAARPAGTADAILGVMPREVYWPRNAGECAEVLTQSAREKRLLAFLGGGTEIALGAPPSELDAVVRTASMARILDYAPADMVITAEAGVTLAQLQAAVAEHRQMLALDPPNQERATIGGLVATGAYGPRRARYGAVRDLIIGVTLVRADGVMARGGGKVVKNVAGFDLPKVACGSLGTLGMIADATFRLHPLPEASATVRFDALTTEGVFALVKRARDAQLEPTSVVALRSNGGYDVGVRFEGFARGVEQQSERILAFGGCERDDGSFWSRHDSVRTGGALRVRIASLPARFAAVEEAIALLLDRMHRPSFAWYATLGLGFVSGDIGEAALIIGPLHRARKAVMADGGSLVIETAPHDVRAGIDVWGETPDSFPIMEQLKLRFDPHRRLNPGRFVGGL